MDQSNGLFLFVLVGEQLAAGANGDRCLGRSGVTIPDSDSSKLSIFKLFQVSPVIEEFADILGFNHNC